MVDFAKLGGWIDDQKAVEEVVQGLPVPVFTCPDPTAITDKQDVLLYEAVRKVLGKDLEPYPQKIGDCVGHGKKNSVDHLQCVMIMNGTRSSFKPTSPESIYALSRVEVGGGRLGNSDGSVGAWAAKAVNQYGVLAQDIYGEYDIRKYSGERSKSWGYRGLPDQLEPDAREHIVKTVSLVRSYEEAKLALKSGYPITVCSNQGFTLTRDSSGFCQASGSWGHAMSLIGIIESDGKPSVVCMNSWGPNMPKGPLSDWKLPVNAFRIHASVADRMLRHGDSFSISGFVGYPPQTVIFEGLLG